MSTTSVLLVIGGLFFLLMTVPRIMMAIASAKLNIVYCNLFAFNYSDSGNVVRRIQVVAANVPCISSGPAI